MVESSSYEVRITVEEKRKKEAMVHFLLNTYKKYYPKLLEKRELEAKEAAQAVSVVFWSKYVVDFFPTRVTMN